MTQSSSSISVELPDGSTASFAEMQAYGEVLQSFIKDQEFELQGIEDVERHNAIIDYLHCLADAYNTQLRQFKIAEKQRQAAHMVALMRFVGG
ncbi:MAG: hypothetical protein AAGA91_04950 [Pseudomonadota bacterium]